MIGTWVLTGLSVLIWGLFALAGFGAAMDPQYGALHAPYYFHTPLIILGLSLVVGGLTILIGPRQKTLGTVGRASLVISLLFVLPYGCFYTGGM
jgi:predicted phage tail protein